MPDSLNARKYNSALRTCNAVLLTLKADVFCEALAIKDFAAERKRVSRLLSQIRQNRPLAVARCRPADSRSGLSFHREPRGSWPGAITAILKWRLYADPGMAPLRRSLTRQVRRTRVSVEVWTAGVAQERRTSPNPLAKSESRRSRPMRRAHRPTTEPDGASRTRRTKLRSDLQTAAEAMDEAKTLVTQNLGFDLVRRSGCNGRTSSIEKAPPWRGRCSSLPYSSASLGAPEIAVRQPRRARRVACASISCPVASLSGSRQNALSTSSDSRSISSSLPTTRNAGIDPLAGLLAVMRDTLPELFTTRKVGGQHQRMRGVARTARSTNR